MLESNKIADMSAEIDRMLASAQSVSLPKFWLNVSLASASNYLKVAWLHPVGTTAAAD